MDLDDGILLHRYVAERAQDAFTALVHRHFSLVYRAAWRQLDGDGRLVEDVTQTVFIQLARKAASLTRHPSLAGWLHTTTRYTAARAKRSERRRHGREMGMAAPGGDDAAAKLHQAAAPSPSHRTASPGAGATLGRSAGALRSVHASC